MISNGVPKRHMSHHIKVKMAVRKSCRSICSAWVQSPISSTATSAPESIFQAAMGSEPCRCHILRHLSILIPKA